MTALVANAGAALHGTIMNLSYHESLKVYYSKVGAAAARAVCLDSCLE